MRSGNGFVTGMPAIVIGDHSDSTVAEFGFAGEFGFGDIGHSDDVKIHGAVHMGFSESRKLRSFDANVSALAMDFDGTVDASVGEHTGDLRTSGLVKGDMGDEPSAKKSRDAIFCAIDELVRNEKFAGGEIFF